MNKEAKELIKEAGLKKNYNKAVDEFNKNLYGMDFEDAVKATHNVEVRTENKYPSKKRSKDKFKKSLLGATPGAVVGAIGSATGNQEMKYLGMLGGAVGAINGANKVNKKYIKQKTDSIYEEIDAMKSQQKTASEQLDELFKEAKDGDNKKDKAKTVASGAVGAKMLHSSKDRILGQKTLYHGTSKKNWESIKKEGLKASRGGIGGAGASIGDEAYQHASKGKIHLTGKKSKALFYNRVNAAGEAMKNNPKIQELESIKAKYKGDKPGSVVFPMNKEGLAASKKFRELNEYSGKQTMKEMINPKNRQGKTLKVKMDYDKWKNNFDVDPDEYGGAIMKKFGDKTPNKKVRGIVEGYSKNIAARGAVDVGTDEIVGLHKASKRIGKTVKNMPNYIKNNKGRFGTGVALAGAGSAMVGKAIKDAIKTEKKASEQLDELYKEAGLINHASKVVNGVKSVAPKIKPIQGAVKPKKIVGDLNV